MINNNLNGQLTETNLYSLRNNNILNWIEDLENVNRYKKILNDCSIISTLSVESGIVKIYPSGYYINHNFAPHVLKGFSFCEIAVVLRYEIIKFEDKYGEVLLNDEKINKLKQIIYKFNSNKAGYKDKKELIWLEQSAEVLYYILSNKVIFEKQINGWCTLTFINDDNSQKDYCTIFNEEEIALLEIVNKSIRRKR